MEFSIFCFLLFSRVRFVWEDTTGLQSVPALSTVPRLVWNPRKQTTIDYHRLIAVWSRKVCQDMLNLFSELTRKKWFLLKLLIWLRCSFCSSSWAAGISLDWESLLPLSCLLQTVEIRSVASSVPFPVTVFVWLLEAAHRSFNFYGIGSTLMLW